MKTHHISYSFLLVFFTFFFLKKCYFDRKNYVELIENGSRTIGSVHNIGVSGDYYCSYTVNGIEYSFRKNKPYNNLISGEKFMVAYDPADPENAYNLFFEPYIQDSLFETTVSTYVKNISFASSFNFKYLVNGEEYTRSSIPRPTQEMNEEKSYLVKYKKSDPLLGYIFIDSLVEQ